MIASTLYRFPLRSLVRAAQTITVVSLFALMFSACGSYTISYEIDENLVVDAREKSDTLHLPDSLKRPSVALRCKSESGTVTFDTARKALVYTPARGFAGNDYYTATVTDSLNGELDVKVNINVLPAEIDSIFLELYFKNKSNNTEKFLFRLVNDYMSLVSDTVHIPQSDQEYARVKRKLVSTQQYTDLSDVSFYLSRIGSNAAPLDISIQVIARLTDGSHVTLVPKTGSLIVNSDSLYRFSVINPVPKEEKRINDSSFALFSAMKSIAGETPSRELFDIFLRFKFSDRLFFMGSFDLAYSETKDSVTTYFDTTSQTQRDTNAVEDIGKKFSDAGMSLNVTFLNVSNRLLFVGIFAKIFNTTPYYGVQFGGIEVGGDFLSSYVTAGYAQRFYQSSLLITDDITKKLHTHNLYIEFALTSKLFPLKVIEYPRIKGQLLLPLSGTPTSDDIQTRISVELPLDGIIQFP